MVNDGTYLEYLDFKGKAITVSSVNGASTAVLDAQFNGVIATFATGEGAGSTLRGFTLTHGTLAIYLQATSPTLTDNIFDANSTGQNAFAEAIEGHGASPDVQRNLFRNHTCATFIPIGVLAFNQSSSPRIANNVIAMNGCRGLTLFLPTTAHPLVVNNTFIGNYGAIFLTANTSAAQQTFVNNILYNDLCGLEVAGLAPGNEPAWKNNLSTDDYCGIPSQTGLNGNVSFDPYGELVEWDFPLLVGSGAIDSGDDAAIAFADKDFDGQPRSVDGNGDCIAHVDLGATEFRPPQSAEIAPGTLDFGNVPVNTTAAWQPLTLTNSGLGCLGIHSISAAAYFATDPGCGTQLQRNASCTVSANFSPTVAGPLTGTLTVDSDSMHNPQTATLRGTGVDFQLHPPAGPVVVDSGSSAQLHIAVVQLGGTYPLPVSLACAGLPQYAACQFSPVSLAPSADDTTGGSTLTITTAPLAVAATSRPAIPYLAWVGVPLLGLAMVTRVRTRGIWLALVAALAINSLSCGGGSVTGGTTKPPVQGTPPGTYVITVNATSSAATHTGSITLQVR